MRVGCVWDAWGRGWCRARRVCRVSKAMLICRSLQHVLTRTFTPHAHSPTPTLHSNPPTAEEMRATAEANARAEADEAAEQKEHQLLVTAMLHCSPNMMVRVDKGAIGEECPVCIEALCETDEYRRLPCGHPFHAVCIDTWLNRHVTCPMCAVSLVETSSALDLKAAKETLEMNRAAARAGSPRSPTPRRPRRLSQL
jgi:hypothetical protein